MKKFCFCLILLAAAVVSLSAAEKKAAPKAEPKISKSTERAIDKWTFFQIVFLPGVPSAAQNSNVYGIKSGWPITCGYGRLYGLEASWFYSGTEDVKGIQASWLCCYNQTCDGIQSSFVVSINRKLMRGLQATMLYTHAGDMMGVQGGGITLADNVYGLQAGLLYAQAKDVKGFQASAVCVNTGKLSGVQCNLYGQVADSNGVQLGIVNVSHGKGLQFGLINYVKDGFLPVFPILNFAF